jgi:hypothetical protein
VGATRREAASTARHVEPIVLPNAERAGEKRVGASWSRPSEQAATSTRGRSGSHGIPSVSVSIRSEDQRGQSRLKSRASALFRSSFLCSAEPGRIRPCSLGGSSLSGA